MPPLPPTSPRVILYHQTHYHNGNYVSMLPLQSTGVTHVIIAAIHLNDPAGRITLNDHVHDHALFDPLWAEMRTLQAAGIKVLGMLGGAAQGSFARLDGDDEARFESYYAPLRDMVRQHGFDGLDLDVEEEMSLAGVVRLIDRLHGDFGPDFLLTLAPVATALQRRPHLSGFDYDALEAMRGHRIAWYHAQFYCNWGDITSTAGYDVMVQNCGWPPEKVVVGVLTNPANAHGWVPLEVLYQALMTLADKYPGFGGVAGWEYFNSLPGEHASPWEFAESMKLLFVQ